MRIFYVPHAGGSLASVPKINASKYPFLKSVDTPFEIVPVLLPGRDFLSSVPQMQTIQEAARYCADFIKRHLSFPYCIAGSSVGAIIALHVCKLIEQECKYEVPLMCFLFAHPPPCSYFDGPSGTCSFRLYSQMNDRDLAEALASWGAVIPPSLMEVALDRTRADLKLGESGVLHAENLVLDTPIVALYGELDAALCPENKMQLWNRHSQNTLVEAVANHGHFFFLEDSFISRTLLPFFPEFERYGISRRRDVFVDASELTIHGCFLKRAVCHPHRNIMKYHDQEYSYAWIVSKMKRMMERMGSVDPDQVIVAPVLPKSPEYVVTCFSAMCLGCPALPLEGGPSIVQNKSFLAKLVADCASLGKSILFVVSTASEESFFSEFSNVISFACDHSHTDFADDVHYVLARTLYRPRSSAFLVFSSGSTGPPKLITVLHTNHVLSYAKRRDAIPFLDDTQDIEVCNIFFLWECFRPLLFGVRLLILSDDQQKNPSTFFSVVSRECGTRIQLTPSMARVLCDGLIRKSVSIDTLNCVTLCGEVVNRKLVRDVQTLFPCAAIWNVYSISECSEITVSNLSAWVGNEDVGDIAPIGFPLPTVDMFVRDEELFVGGPHVGNGYVGAPDKSRAKFVSFESMFGSAVDFQLDETLYRTGDRCFFDTNLGYSILGRCDFAIRVRGNTVDAQVVEDAILNCFPEVKQCLVVGRQMDTDSALVAHMVIPQGGDDLCVVYMRDRLQGVLPSYAVPYLFVRYPTFFRIDPISGKTDRKCLVDPQAHPEKLMPSSLMADASSNIHTPATDYWIQRVCAAWTKELLVRVGASDRWLSLGGHSLAAVRVVATLQHDIEEFAAATAMPSPPFLNIEEMLKTSVTPASLAATITVLFGSRQHSVKQTVSSTCDVSDCIAIVGMGIQAPDAANIHEFWRNLVSGHVSAVLEKDMDGLWRRPQNSGSTFPSIPNSRGDIDPAFFSSRIHPSEWELMDPQHRIALEVSLSAMMDAGFTFSNGSLAVNSAFDDTAVFGSCYLPTYGLNTSVPLFRGEASENPSLELSAEIGNDKDYLPMRLAYAYGLRGTAVAVQSSCSSSLSCLEAAFNHLSLKKNKYAIVCSASMAFFDGIYNGYRAPSDFVLSSDGHCRPFDSRASGTVFSDAAATIVLARLSKEELCSGEHKVYATVRDVRSNQDGSSEKSSFGAPSSEAQTRLLSSMYESLLAGPSENPLQFVEAHATGTIVGDPIEFSALRNAIGARLTQRNPVWIGCAKANVGHCNIAAGLVGVVKTALSMYHGQIPPTPTFSEWNPLIAMDPLKSRFSINGTATVPWPSADVRRAGVSAMGVGGTNCHCILERQSFCDVPVPDPHEPSRFSALTVAMASEESFKKWLRSTSNSLMRSDVSIGWSSAASFFTRHFPRPGLRCFTVVASSKQDLKAVVDAMDDSSTGFLTLFSGPSLPTTTMLIVCPGQTSFSPVLYRELFLHCPEFRVAVTNLQPYTSVPVDRVFSSAVAAEHRYSQTEVHVYSALLQYGLFSILRAVYASAAFRFIGHSLGELIAVWLAGAIDDRSFFQVLELRAAALETYSPDGDQMFVVKHPVDHIRKILSGLLGVRTNIVSVNPGNAVVVGCSPGLSPAVIQQEFGNYALIPTDRVFHGSHLALVAASFDRNLNELSLDLNIDALRSVDVCCGARIEDQSGFRQWCTDHLVSSVRFDSAVDRVSKEYDNLTLVELAWKPSLSSMILKEKRNWSGLALFAKSPMSGSATCSWMWTQLSAGRKAAFCSAERPVAICDDLPALDLPFERKRIWRESPRRDEPPVAHDHVGKYCIQHALTDISIPQREYCLDSHPSTLRLCDDCFLLSVGICHTFERCRESILQIISSHSGDVRIIVFFRSSESLFVAAVLSQEYFPRVRCVSVFAPFSNVDVIQMGRCVLDSIDQDLLQWGDTIRLGKMDDEQTFSVLHRQFRALKLANLERAESPANIVIFGGLGTLGRILSATLASDSQFADTRIVLTTRCKASDVDCTRCIEEIEQLSSAMADHRVRLASRVSVLTEFDGLSAAQWNFVLASLSDPVVIFCAGLADLCWMAEGDRMAQECEPKSDALQALFDSGSKIRRCIGFSSLAAYLGGPGMMFYGSANLRMDALFCKLTAQHSVVSVAWDDWDVHALRHVLLRKGVPLSRSASLLGLNRHNKKMQMKDIGGSFGLPVEYCMELVKDLLLARSTRGIPVPLIVSKGDLLGKVDSWIYGKTSKVAPVDSCVPTLSNQDAREVIRHGFASFLKMSVVDEAKSFFVLGGDSMSALMCVAMLQEALRRKGFSTIADRLTVKRLFESLSIEQFVDSVMDS
eukprot:ANDGO_00917.mRNA.1 Polyketide synthase PksN